MFWHGGERQGQGLTNWRNNMGKENFAMQLVEKQLRRDEYKFYAVVVLFLVFMFFSYLYPSDSSTNTKQEVLANDNVNVTSEVNNDSEADSKRKD